MSTLKRIGYLFLGIIVFAFIAQGIIAISYRPYLHEMQVKMHEEAMQLQPLAEHGNAEAQYELGKRYSHEGWGVEENPAEAAKWYRLSADQGNANAQFCLGLLYADGGNFTVAKDSAAAVKLFTQSAMQDNQFAEFRLGRIFERGEGVVQDNVQAYFWYMLAQRHPYFSRAIDNQSNRIARQMTKEQLLKAKTLLNDWKPKNDIQYVGSIC